MAIVIEEEKKKVNWLGLSVTALVVVVIGTTIYYLFLSPVPLIEKVLPQRLQSIKTISSTDFRPDAVINHPNYKVLRQYVNPVDVPAASQPRSNPFLPLR